MEPTCAGERRGWPEPPQVCELWASSPALPWLAIGREPEGSVRVCVHACMHASMRVCMRACVRVCVHACVCFVCVCVRERE